MALSRRTGQRFQASIWPGFVDAMTGLLLVLMFVLTIFMVVQFVLRETITGQETELNALAGEVAALAQALGLEELRADQLDSQVTSLNATLNDTQSEVQQQAALIAALSSERDVAQSTTATSPPLKNQKKRIRKGAIFSAHQDQQDCHHHHPLNEEE